MSRDRLDDEVATALAELRSTAANDRWLLDRLDAIGAEISRLRERNEELDADLGAAYCRMDDMEARDNG